MNAMNFWENFSMFFFFFNCQATTIIPGMRTNKIWMMWLNGGAAHRIQWICLWATEKETTIQMTVTLMLKPLAMHPVNQWVYLLHFYQVGIIAFLRKFQQKKIFLHSIKLTEFDTAAYAWSIPNETKRIVSSTRYRNVKIATRSWPHTKCARKLCCNTASKTSSWFPQFTNTKSTICPIQSWLYWRFTIKKRTTIIIGTTFIFPRWLYRFLYSVEH